MNRKYEEEWRGIERIIAYNVWNRKKYFCNKTWGSPCIIIHDLCIATKGEQSLPSCRQQERTYVPEILRLNRSRLLFVAVSRASMLRWWKWWERSFHSLFKCSISSKSGVGWKGKKMARQCYLFFNFRYTVVMWNFVKALKNPNPSVRVSVRVNPNQTTSLLPRFSLASQTLTPPPLPPPPLTSTLLPLPLPSLLLLLPLPSSPYLSLLPLPLPPPLTYLLSSPYLSPLFPLPLLCLVPSSSLGLVV